MKRSEPRFLRRSFLRAIVLFFPLLFLFPVAFLIPTNSAAQSLSDNTSDNTDRIRGVVIDSVTREPIARALVSSPDDRFATMTNSEGRFEFNLPKVALDDSNSNGPVMGRTQPAFPNRPYTLTARKPGFLPDRNRGGQIPENAAGQDLTLVLVPESLVTGTVTLPTSEAPDSILLQIFRRDVQDGTARWVPAGTTQSKSDGQFRFAELAAGTYKLVTRELLDRDPLAFDPRGQLFGYPPVYYQNAPDFGSASTIQLSAGETHNVTFSLVKQPYYRVKVPVIAPATDTAEIGVGVNVYAHGHKGPGFSLGYNAINHAIEGMLPNGTYTVEASSFGPRAMNGSQTVAVKGGPADGPAVSLAPAASIAVNVKEEFTSPVDRNSPWGPNGRTGTVRGPRRYLNVMLESNDDFGQGRNVSLRNPTGGEDDSLVIEGASPGSYWVRVNSSHGYPSSIRSGNLDLLHQPLIVGSGGGASPIEITIRDDMAEISGSVEGVPPPAQRGVAGGVISQTYDGASYAYLYCIPLPDSSGRFTGIRVQADGNFDSQGLPPGVYRLLAFDHEPPELEYRNPDAMQVYDSKGLVIHLVGGQKERVQVQLISTEHPYASP
jgi:hypothetical protein